MSLLYGFRDISDLFPETVASRPEESNTAITRFLDEHNRQMNALYGLFVEPTTKFKERIKLPNLARLQPITEHGQARPIKTAGYYDLAWPIFEGAAGTGWTWKYGQRATVADLMRDMATIQIADIRWVRDHMVAAMLDHTNLSFADEEFGDLTIKPLANNDTDTYQLRTGADSEAIDNHYLAQAAAISDSADPFPTIVDELTEHPENDGGEVVVFISSSLKTTVQGLAGFTAVADARLQVGSATTVLKDTLGVDTPGKLIGYHDSGCWIVEWRHLPSGYMLAVMTGGERPLRMRQYEEAGLQGLIRNNLNLEHPFSGEQYYRAAGFGAWNRVGVVVYYVGDASYVIPTGYTRPIK